MHPAMEQLAHLPLAERLQLVQDLWDSIGNSQEQLPVSEWHRQLAQARLAELDPREEEIGLSEQQVWDRVDQLRGSLARLSLIDSGRPSQGGLVLRGHLTCLGGWVSKQRQTRPGRHFTTARVVPE